VTTTVCGAVKESLKETSREWGLFAAGGKGAASRKSPAQIADAVARRAMPPWPPEPGHGEFIGSRRLSDTEIATITDGSREGRLKGTRRSCRRVRVGAGAGNWANRT